MNIIALNNGIKIALNYVPDMGFSVIQLRGLAGSNYEAENQIGAAHLCEHVHMYQFASDITGTGANVVGMSDRDYVFYMVKALKDDMNTAINYLANIFFSSDINSHELDINKSIVISEVNRIFDNPEKLLSRLGTYDLMYENNRIHKLNTGNVEDIKSLRISNIKKYKVSNYLPSKFCIALYGDFEEQIVLKNLSEMFDEKLAETPTVKDIDLQVKGIFACDVIENNKTLKNYLRIDYPGYKMGNNDKYALQILSQYLQLQLNKERTAYIQTVTNNVKHNFGQLEVFIELQKETTVNNINKTYNIIANTVQNIDQKTFQQAQINVLTQLVFDTEKLSAKADFYTRELLENKILSFDETLERYKSLTTKDIELVAQNVLNKFPKIRAIGNINKDDLSIFEKK